MNVSTSAKEQRPVSVLKKKEKRKTFITAVSDHCCVTMRQLTDTDGLGRPTASVARQTVADVRIENVAGGTGHHGRTCMIQERERENSIDQDENV